MRGSLRFGTAGIAAALAALAPQPLLAQDSAPATNTPAPETVGPRELEGFSLNGTVTRQAEPQATRTDPVRSEPAPDAASVEPPPASPPAPVRSEPPRPRAADQAAPVAPAASPASSGALPDTSPFTPAPEAQIQPAAAAESGFSGPVDVPAPPAAEQSLELLPWLLALAFAAGAALFLFWRQRSQRELAVAGGSPLAFAAPDPKPAPAPTPPPPQPRARVPQPAPAPLPPAAAPRVPAGIVSTRLRPWIDIEFTPTRCIVEEERAIIQFAVAMFNSGSASARDVLLEMGIFNAGPTQDEEIGHFQAKQPGNGRRVAVIEPLRRVEQSSQIAVPLDKLRVFEANGRRFFVPMLTLNAYYSWGGGEGRSAASFLVGRDGNGGDKMSPFRLDLGPRVFRNLGAREHHLRVRV